MNFPPCGERPQRCILRGLQNCSRTPAVRTNQPILTKRQQPSPWQRVPRGPIRVCWNGRFSFAPGHQNKQKITEYSPLIVLGISLDDHAVRSLLMLKIHTRRAAREKRKNRSLEENERELMKNPTGTDFALIESLKIINLQVGCQKHCMVYTELAVSHWRTWRCNPRELQAQSSPGRTSVASRLPSRRPSSCCNPSGTDRKEARIPRRPSAGGERSPWSTLRYLTPSPAGRKYTGTRQLFCCALVPAAAAACMCMRWACQCPECGWRTHRRHLAPPPPSRQGVDLFVYVLAHGFYGRSSRAASAQRPPPLAHALRAGPALASSKRSASDNSFFDRQHLLDSGVFRHVQNEDSVTDVPYLNK